MEMEDSLNSRKKRKLSAIDETINDVIRAYSDTSNKDSSGDVNHLNDSLQPISNKSNEKINVTSEQLQGHRNNYNSKLPHQQTSSVENLLPSTSGSKSVNSKAATTSLCAKLPNQRNLKFPTLPPAKRPLGYIKPLLNAQEKASSLLVKDSGLSSIQTSSTACRSTDDKQLEIYVPESTKTENMEVAESLAESSSPILLQHKVMNWISCNGISQPTHNTSTIPLVFKQLCFYHFTSKCARKNYACNRKHYVAPEIGCRIRNLQFDQLDDAYTYAKERCTLYPETVLDFLEAFEKKNDAPQLIRCVGDILSNNMFDKTPYVEKILFHLCRLGTSFGAAVNKIFEEYNSKNAHISDILLDIICCRRKQDICTNWHLVQKLTKNRVEPMDYILVEELVKMCCEFDSVNLAKYIVQDIIKPLSVDFEKVNSDLLKHFLLVLQSHNLEQEKRLVLNKIDTYRNNQSSKSPISAENVDENNRTNTLSGDISYSKFNSEAKHSNSQSNGLKYASDLTRLNLEDIVSEDSFASDESSTASEGSNTHLDSYDSVMLSAADLLNLKNVIQEGDKVNFLLLLLSFKNDSIGRQRQFVLKTLMRLKVKTPAEVYSMVFQVLTSIGIMARDYMKDVGLKNILTMLAINVIGLLENSKLYKEASNILLKFNENLESLMDTTWFTNCHRYEYSEGGKFIYFCKIFTKGDHFKEAWKVLTMPKYNLIYGVNKWKLGHKDPFDNVFRNYVLEDVLCVSLSTDTPFAKMVLLRILQDKDLIVEIDIWKHCNQLLLTLLDNSENYIEELRDLLENIMEGWYKNLSKEVMRGLLVCLLPEISGSDAWKLYNICCEQDYYPCVKGDEKTLSLNPEMFPEEIHMTLHDYFYKKATNNFPLRDLVLFINLPNALVHQSKPSSSCNEMIHSMKTKISSVLEFSLPYTITMNCVEQESQHVLLKANDLERCYSHYQKMYSCKNVQ